MAKQGGRRLAPVTPQVTTRGKDLRFTEADFKYDDRLNLIFALHDDDLEKRLKHLDSLGEIGGARQFLLQVIQDQDGRERRRLAAALIERRDLEVDKTWPKLDNALKRIHYLLAQVAVSVPPDSSLPPKSQATQCDQMAKEYEKEHRDLKRKFMKRLLPALKEEIPTRPSNTYVDKLELVRWINAELQRFDVAIMSPSTGRAAILSADTTGTRGRFKIKGTDEHGTMTTINISTASELVAKLALIESPPRREPLKEWRERVGLGEGVKRT